MRGKSGSYSTRSAASRPPRATRSCVARTTRTRSSFASSSTRSRGQAFAEKVCGSNLLEGLDVKVSPRAAEPLDQAQY
jgi:hypothetical protein